MRRFNPEKELRKIQHGNRNKVLYGVILLLLIISIGSTYALYQVRYSKRIIYTKVVPFSNVTFIKPDNVTIIPSEARLVSGESKQFTATIPTGYEIDTVTCTNGSVSEVTKNTFKVTYTTSKASVCTVTLTDFPSLFSYCLANEQLSTCIPKALDLEDLVEDDTTNKNIRYIGAKPSNYIWFNCDDYSADMNETNCERWRIIGLFKGIRKPSGGTEDLVKIIRENIIGYIAWDASSYYGTNSWSRPATLQKGLNGPYFNNSDNGEWITQAEYTMRYDNVRDESYKGITPATKNMIEYVTWNIGGRNSESATAKTFYTAERGSTVPTGATTCNGYIGLMYPSDYGYAAETSCWSTNLNSYNNGCYEKDWLFGGLFGPWTMTPLLNNNVFVNGTNGSLGNTGPTGVHGIMPSLYLSSSVTIVNGDGSSENPYIIIP